MATSDHLPTEQKTESHQDSKDDDSLFDVLMLGRTGTGKSTTGNTLLKANAPRSFNLELFDSRSGAQSATKSCKLLTNDRVRPHLRVLDVQGFAPSNALKDGYNIYQANLAILREILLMQYTERLAFKRILYFLPGRGPPERADSSLQEEIAVMHYFFGNTIFENMVVVTTVPPSMSRKGALPDVALEEGRKVFQVALECVIQKTIQKGQVAPKIPNPPIMYLSMEDTGEDLLGKVKEQSVIHSNGLKLEFSNDVCARCATKLMTIQGKTAYAFDNTGKPVVYGETFCHPTFVRKFGKTKRVVGGISIIFTLGLSSLAGAPWFTNSEEVCLNHKCRQPPGSRGCMKVGEKLELSAVTSNIEAANPYITTDHTNELDV